MTTETPALPVITEDAVKFVQGVIEIFCSEERLLVIPTWTPHTNPTDLLQGVQLLRERCDLDYPLLNKQRHFHSGVQLLVENRDGRLLLHFVPTTDAEPADSTHRGGLIDLHDCEKHYHENSKERDVLVYSIGKAIRIALKIDTERLSRFRGPNRN